MMSKTEKFCLLLGIIALVHLIIGRSLVIAGIEFLIIAVIYVVYVALNRDGPIKSFVEYILEEGRKAARERRQELEEKLNQQNHTEADETIAKCNEAIDLNPHDSSAYMKRASSYSIKNDEEQAIADYTKAIELMYRPLSEPYTNRGNCYQILGEYDKAFEDYNKAIQLDSNYALAYYNRAHCHKEMGEENLAMTDIRKALDLVDEPLLKQAF
jgi:tetratricopeptide (TPR) repeat protein